MNVGENFPFHVNLVVLTRKAIASPPPRPGLLLGGLTDRLGMYDAKFVLTISGIPLLLVSSDEL